MTKLFGLIFIILLISCEKPPQDSLVLKVKFLPLTAYNYSSEQVLETVITYSGKEKTLKELKRRGHENPTILNKKSITEAIIKTGKAQDDNASFPVKVDYASHITNNGSKEEPVNATFHGKCMRDSIPVFDVAVAKDLDKTSKMYLLESWQKSFSPLSFSGQTLKIGQEFTTENPLFIPMEGSEIEIIAITTYKLIRINNKIADFDIAQKYTLNPKLMDNSFQGSVKGEGHLVYDTEHSIIRSYTLNTSMELTKKLDSFEFHLKTNSRLIQKTNIINKSK